MMTCGKPAVPIISDIVYMNMLSMLSGNCVVYLPKPSSVTTWSSLASRDMSVPVYVPPRPSCGNGLPASCSEMNTAGTV